MGCLICERIEQIKRGENPYFVCELSTGYVVLGDHQRFCGYTLFLSKQHVTELYHLPWEIRTRFLQEMSLVAEAVAAVYHPDKMNVELLGNGDTHLHWHLFPRVAGDTPQPGPVWWLPAGGDVERRFSADPTAACAANPSTAGGNPPTQQDGSAFL